LNGLNKRCDIVVFSRHLTPLMIVECKARHIPLSQKVLDQTMRYNITLNVKYLLLTNGQTQYCIQLEDDGQKVVFLDKIPDYKTLIT
ncbi:MAG: type I restriction enzyme HsdR N-terminal domain-containing protein, partial [Bacteroidales bacterium]|nr:type I restriction enzyme HsdR N-terminal domain-containing protein [Bacteroidales bacterium]